MPSFSSLRFRCLAVSGAGFLASSAIPAVLAATLLTSVADAQVYNLKVVTELPAKYSINVGGADHPVVKSLRVNPKGTLRDAKHGYSDGKDVGGEKFIYRWVTYGKNLAEGRPYTVSVPSNNNWGAGDPEGKKLTDGVVGPPFAGGVTPGFGLGWNKGHTSTYLIVFLLCLRTDLSFPLARFRCFLLKLRFPVGRTTCHYFAAMLR